MHHEGDPDGFRPACAAQRAGTVQGSRQVGPASSPYAVRRSAMRRASGTWTSRS
ncbi:MAG TPA: hypothetical protein VFW50_17960 [Streptosporangiaceae bacterium]|nr:hypothetical protein [Streptosporangiaceae bacterium]